MAVTWERDRRPRRGWALAGARRLRRRGPGLPGAGQNGVARGLPVHAAAGTAAPRTRRAAARPQSRERGGGGPRRRGAHERGKDEEQRRTTRRETSGPKVAVAAATGRGPRKRRSRDTDLPVLPLLQMHAGHGGRRQHHREAQHRLRAPRHPRAGHCGLLLPAPGPGQSLSDSLRVRVRLDRSSAEPRPPGAPPAAPGASNREPSGVSLRGKRGCGCGHGAGVPLPLLPTLARTHTPVPSERDGEPGPLLHTSFPKRSLIAPLEGQVPPEDGVLA